MTSFLEHTMEEDRRQMDRHLSRVAAILHLANSKKITDRRKFVDNLLDIYDNNAFVNAINIQSSMNFKSSTSWNEIMLTIHRVALSEAERPVSKSLKGNSLAICYSDLVRKTVHLATKTLNLYLSCNDLMACIFEVLNEKVYKVHQETYCNILLKHVLANKMYWLQVTSGQWEEILRISLKLYRGSSNTFKSVLLNTVGLIVQCGCLKSHLLLNVKKILHFLEERFQEIDTDETAILMALYKLTYTVCQQIGTESRIALCEFSEKILPSIICLETCPEKIDILLLLVQIHQPCGFDNSANYVSDPDLWRSIMTRIHANIVTDINTENRPVNFWKLCCEVYRQTMQDPLCLTEASSCIDESEDEQPRKRRRLLKALRIPTYLLMDNDPEVAEPFIRILTELLRKYPNSLTLTDYPLFLKKVMEIASASRDNEMIMNNLCKLCSVVIEIERKHFHEVKEAKNIKLYWATICDIILWQVNVSKIEIFGHELLQLIIKYKNVLDTKEFLSFYISNDIRWSYSSVETLLTFCTYMPIPDHFSGPKIFTARPNSTIKASLLHWALNIPIGKSFTEIPAVSLANLLTALAMKFSYKEGFREFQNNRNRVDRNKIAAAEVFESELFDNRESKALSDIEICHLALEFYNVVIEFPEEATNIDTRMSTVHTQEILDTVITNLSASLEIPVTDENISMLVIKTTVVAKLLSNFLDLDAKFESLTSKLYESFCEAYKSILAHLITMKESTSSYLVQVLEALEIFYRIQYNCKIVDMIIESTTMDLILYVFDFLVEEDEDSQNDENCEIITVRNVRDQTSTFRLSDACRVKNSCHKILTYFGCVRIGEKISPLLIKVLKNITKADLYEITSSVDLRRALSFLKIFAESNQYLANEEPLIITMAFLKNLFETGRKDEIVVRGILNVLPHFVKFSANLSSSNDPLLSILSEIYISLYKKNYGPLVHADFIKCLTKLIHINPFLKWKIDAARGTSTIIEILPSYINNPFYVVRLEVVRALHALFSSENLDGNWKLQFFGKVISGIENLFIVTEINDACERADELSTRTATAIHILIAVIRSNEFLQSRALHVIVELFVREDVKIMLIKRALLSVTKNETERRRLFEINLYDLLSRWFKAENPIHTFPWALMDCNSQEDFSRKYIEVLLTIKLHRLELHEFEILCNNLDVSFSRTIEQFFPIVVSILMAMIARESSRQEVKSNALQIWQRLRSNAGEFAGVKKFEVLLEEKLSEIVVDILQRLNDRENLFIMLDVNFFLPKIHSPNFKAGIIDSCLRNLKMELPIGKCSLMEYLVTRRPSTVQRILLMLFCNVHDARTTENKILAFHQYSYFYTQILQEISLPQFDLMSLYIVRDLSHSLLFFMADKSSLSGMACSFFQIFLRSALPARANEIKTILSFAVSKLVPIIQAREVKSAIDVLRCLIIDHTEVLGEAITKLDSFPNDRIFETVKQVHVSLKYSAGRIYSLEDEIEHFLNADREETPYSSFESLFHIQNQISTRKEELYELYSKLKNFQDFQKDYSSNTLHRLMYKLVRLTKSSHTNISLMAAKCLGELGPADLTTITLHAESGYCKEVRDEVEMLTLNVIRLLADYQIENDTNLRKASTDALYAVFSSTGRAKFKEKVKEKPNLYSYVYPFDAESTNKKSQPIKIHEENWEIFVKQSTDLWIPSKYNSYSQWISEITCRCFDCFVNFYGDGLKPICRLDVKFCEMLLPRLLNLVRKTQKSLLNDICVCVNRFFRYVFELNRSPCDFKDVEETNVARSYGCVKCMLNVVNFMRIQTSDYVTLPFDYLLVAKVAQYCSAYCTSVFYAELWCENVLREPELKRKRLCDRTSGINLICTFKPESGKLLQDIVREAYMNLDDPDSIYGCGLSILMQPSIKTQHYTYLKQWDKVTLANDLALTFGKNAIRDLCNSLNQSGYHYLLKRLTNKVNKKTENLADFRYETAWRLADWSIFEQPPVRDSENPQKLDKFDYHAAHYRALQSLRDDDTTSLEIALENARTNIVQSLRNTSLECSQILYPMLSRLQMLQEIEKLATKKQETYNAFFNDSHQQDFIESYDFQYIEPILSQRLVMLQMQKSADNIANIDDAVVNTHLKIGKIAETQGYLSSAHQVLRNLGKKSNISEAARDQLHYQEALLDWKAKDQYMGRSILRSLLRKPSLDAKLHAKVLRIYGNWMTETSAKTSNDIITNYYKVSIEKSLNMNDIDTLSNAQADLAQFADTRYQEILKFTKTPQYECLAEVIELKDDAKIRKQLEKDNDLRKAVGIYRRQAAAQATELANIKTETEVYLILAVRNYLRALATSNNHDVLVYRIVSFWLDKNDHDGLNELVKEILPRIASHKFVVLLPQLAAHISNSLPLFTENIKGFMYRCAKEHPHHTLPILLALKNMHKDHEFMPSTARLQKDSSTQSKSRNIAVDELISKLTESNISPIIEEMNQLHDALISLAYYKVPETPKKLGVIFKISQNYAITKIRNFHHTMVPTVTLDVRPSGHYENIVGIREYEETFELLKGIDAPKKLVCIDSHGIRRTQLLKGEDNLTRQDAVLQQVCTIMNSMLKATEETKRRKLRIRTYKIVPLSQKSGVLEWCQNAISMSQILCGTETMPGMHTKYNPNDWSLERCREKLQGVRSSTDETKCATFIECCKNVHPAFHYYFMEKYPSAETWFEKRLAYVRSVATNSIVGFIVGLGDRTPKNILLDQTTGEVIHIYHGIPFNQRKVLSAPEAVPFRLTRDMEAAMGMSGVEGVMKRSCEQTLTMIREKREMLATLLKVLMYEPLLTCHQPSSSGQFSRGYSENQGSAVNAKNFAEKALLHMVFKLEGIEEGLTWSVCGQVERAIKVARDPLKLCLMHCDWQPYL